MSLSSASITWFRYYGFDLSPALHETTGHPKSVFNLLHLIGDDKDYLMSFVHYISDIVIK